MDKAKRCGQAEALKMLLHGAFVFTTIKRNIVENQTGCRKCNVQKKGNFCSNCGSKITEKLQVVVGKDVTEFRLQLFNNDLYMETRKNNEQFFSNKRKCNLSLEFFLNQKQWKWIW